MKLSRASRSIVAVFTAALLLLCQTAALAQMCTTMPAPARDAAAASMPCHTAAVDADSPSQHPRPASVCDASQGLAEIAKAPTFALANIPVLVIASHDVVRALDSGIPHAVHAVCSSPPLSVLHCRFLI